MHFIVYSGLTINLNMRYNYKFIEVEATMGPNQDVIISCTRCTSNVPIGQTTYANNSRNLICFDCYNKIARGQEPDRIVQTAELPDKVGYKCMSCGFSFSRARSFHFGGHCFNCGKASVQLQETSQRIQVKDRKNLLDY